MADVVIIGAGAAGLLCAIEAGKRGREVLVIESNAQIGRKIIISGGGRCNFTNINVNAENFVSENPHFCKSALAGYRPADFVDLVKKHRIPFYEKTLGQLFCRGRSHEIVDMLLSECSQAGVKIITDCKVKSVSNNGGFIIETTKGAFASKSLVIATGGLSFPKIGATGFGYQTARQFGLNIVPTRPSLVPLRFAHHNYTALSGLSIDAQANAGKQIFRENILFTHKGLSGPAILQASNYWQPGGELVFDLLPDSDFKSLLEENDSSNQMLKNFLSEFLPARFVNEHLPETLAETPLSQINEKQRVLILDLVHNWKATFSATEGWDKAEVTLGGVDTKELSSKTMESRKVKGLYFIGEVVDVTGWLGGYNFQWAWSSGFACGRAV